MRRLLAVIGAVGMVAAAWAVRAAIDDDGDAAPDTGDERVLVVCDPDLRAACDALEGVEVQVEDSAVTSAALVSGQLEGVDGWITTAAWRELTESRADHEVGETTTLGSSPVVVAVDADRAEALRSLCSGAAVWRCVGDNAGRSWESLGGEARWGPLYTGLPDADTSVGLSVLASVAAGYFDGTDFAANDFGDLRAWLSRLADASSPGDRDLLRTLVRVRGTYTAGGLVEAAVGDRAELAGLEASPVVDATAVVIDLPGGDPLPGVARPREALAAAGWDAGAGEPASLLKPGVMAALHTLWKDITS